MERAAFKDAYQGLVATSFNNILPKLFARAHTITTESSNFHLPGINSYEKWEDPVRRAGVRIYLRDNIVQAELRLRNHIDRKLDKIPVANRVAQKMLQQSVEFVNKLSKYMDDFFGDLQKAGHSKTVAWDLVCECVYRIFLDMANARMAVGKHVSGPDEAETAARIMWATINTHRVMQYYVAHNLEDHPVLASILARFQAKTSQSGIKDLSALDRKVNTLTKEVSTFQKTLDKAVNDGKGLAKTVEVLSKKIK